MSNSGLISHTNISKNKNPRTHKIDTITIHCVVGQWTVERLGEEFRNPSRKASSNYGVGYDGKVGMYVEEKDRSWCSSNQKNDNRAITIEVASEREHPYEVTNEAFTKLIKLCTDICKRNKIKKLLWKGDKKLIGKIKSQNMTVHRWFAAKDCPGEYLYNAHNEIVYEVNRALEEKLYKVQAVLNSKIDADNIMQKLKGLGIDAFIINNITSYIVQAGAFSKRRNAYGIIKRLKAKGIDNFIIK